MAGAEVAGAEVTGAEVAGAEAVEIASLPDGRTFVFKVSDSSKSILSPSFSFDFGYSLKDDKNSPFILFILLSFF